MPYKGMRIFVCVCAGSCLAMDFTSAYLRGQRPFPFPLLGFHNKFFKAFEIFLLIVAKDQ